MRRRNLPALDLAYPGLLGKFRPALHGGPYLLQQRFVAAALKQRGFGAGAEICQREVVAFTVEARLVPAGPQTLRVVAGSDLKRGGEGSFALPVHQKRDVLAVVVLVAGDRVNEHG